MKWNKDKAEAQARDARDGRGGAWISLKKGESFVGRPLPVEKPASDDDECELILQYGQHYLKATAPQGFYTCLNEPVVSDVSPAVWGKNPCVLCARWKELKASRDSDDQELAKDFNRSIKYLGNVAVDGEVKIHRYNSKSYPLLVGLMSGKYEDVFELRNGRDVEVKCIDDQGGYTLTPERDTSSLRRDILDDLNDLYAVITVLEPKKMAAMLKSGVAPVDDDYVTVRDLMHEKAGTPAAKRPASAEEPDAPVRGRGRAKDESRDDERPATRRELKQLTAFADELGMLGKDEELDEEKLHAELVETIVTEALGSKTKGLSEDLLAWLAEHGCDVGGRLVERVTPTTKPIADDDGDDIEKQIDAVRKASAARSARKK